MPMTVLNCHPSKVDDDERKPDAAGRDGAAADQVSSEGPREIGGPKGPEPTRYGDWERKGRCIDF